MSTDSFEAQLLNAFRIEAKEHVQLLINNFLSIESANEQDAPRLVEQSFRSLHNLKGSAHAVELFTIEALCHPMEDIMFAAKSGTIKLNSEHLDLLLEGTNLVARLLGDEGEESLAGEVEQILARLYAAQSRTGEESSAGDGLKTESVTAVAAPAVAAPAPAVTAAVPAPVAPATEPIAEAATNNRTRQQETLRIPSKSSRDFSKMPKKCYRSKQWRARTLPRRRTC